jgi:hypothetical protein
MDSQGADKVRFLEAGGVHPFDLAGMHSHRVPLPIFLSFR